MSALHLLGALLVLGLLAYLAWALFDAENL